MKMKRFTRLLSLLLVLAMCLSMVPLTVFAVDPVIVSNQEKIKLLVLVDALKDRISGVPYEYKVVDAAGTTIRSTTSDLTKSVTMADGQSYTLRGKTYVGIKKKDFSVPFTFKLGSGAVAHEGRIHYVDGLFDSLTEQQCIDAIYDSTSDIPKANVKLGVRVEGVAVKVKDLKSVLGIDNPGPYLFSNAYAKGKFCLIYDDGNYNGKYYCAGSSKDVSIKLEDTRPAPTVVAKAGTINYYIGQATTPTLADMKAAIYDSSSNIPLDKLTLCVEKVPVTNEKVAEYIADAAALASIDFQLGFGGGVVNGVDYKPVYSNSVKISMVDPRADSTLVAKNGSVEYYPDIEPAVTLQDFVNAVYDSSSTIPATSVHLAVMVDSIPVTVTSDKVIEYIALGEALTDLDFCLTFGGDAANKPAVSNKVKISFTDSRPEPTIVAHAGKVLFNPESPSDVDLQDFIDAIYDDSNTIPKDKLVLSIEKVPVTSEKVSDFVSGTAALADADFQLFYKGGKVTLVDSTEVNYKAGYSNSVKIELVDCRLDTVMEVSEEPITITYGDDLVAAILEAGAVTVKPADEEDTTVIELTAENLSVDPETPNASTEAQPVTVKFKGAVIGESIYKGCTGELQVIVKKAPSHIKVESATVVYDGQPHKMNVESNTDYIALTAGVEGTAIGFLNLDLGGSEAMVNFLLKLLGVDPDAGIPVKELAKIISEANDKLQNPDWFTEFAIKLISASGGKEIIDSLTRILEVLDKLPLEKVDAIIYFGKVPVNAGVYEITAVTINPNYETSVGVGGLVILPQSAKQEIKLSWNQAVPQNSFISWTDAQTFDFGCALVDAQGSAISNVELNQNVTGITFTGKTVQGDAPVRTPGVYTQTVLTYGNYLPVPVARVYTIQRQSVKINATKAVLVADGTPKEIPFTVTTEDGKTETADAVSAAVKVTYVGMTDSGKAYNSTVAPTEAGAYTVTFTYEGTEDLAGSMTAVTLEITTPEPSRVASIIRGIAGLFKKK